MFCFIPGKFSTRPRLSARAGGNRPSGLSGFGYVYGYRPLARGRYRIQPPTKGNGVSYCMLGPPHQTETYLGRHHPIDLYDPQPLPAHEL